MIISVKNVPLLCLIGRSMEATVSSVLTKKKAIGQSATPASCRLLSDEKEKKKLHKKED